MEELDFPADRKKYDAFDFRATEINPEACKIIKLCIFNNVLEELAERCFHDKYLEMALKTASPDVVSNGNRLEILAFVFKKYAEGYLKNKEQRKKYLNECCERIKKKWPDCNFDTASPGTEIQNKIWDDKRKKFKK